MHRLTRGDEAAFREVFESCWERVFSLCLHYSGSEADAKDLTQNIFAALWQNRSRLGSVEKLENYLSSAARYQCFNHIRNKVARHRKLSDWPDHAAPLMTADPDPAQFTEQRQLSMYADRFIDDLPEPGKTIFIMNRAMALSYQEIAARRGISVKTVQYHISSALRSLRSRWMDLY